MDRNNKLLLILTAGICVVLTAVFGVIFVLSEANDKQEEKPPVSLEQNAEKNQVDAVEYQKTEFRVSFAAAGDNIVHDMVRKDASNNASQSQEDFNFLPMYEYVSELIEEADLAYVNQEAPVGGKELGYSGYPNFNAPEKSVYDLADVGFDIFNLANNHMLDRGTVGYQNTVAFFNSLEGIINIGGYVNDEDYENICLVEKNGITIAFLSYTYGTNGYSLSADSKMVVPYANDDEIDRQTKLARDMADFVVVSMHWGEENSHDVNATQKRQMQIMVDNNVDVIIGTHPHVLQPVEWQERPDGNKTLVMYSLGNFLSNMEKMKHHVGAIAMFDFVKDEFGTRIENARFVPIMCHFEYDGINKGYKIYRLSEYTDDLLDSHARQNTNTDVKCDMNYLIKIVSDNIPQELLTEDFYINN